MIPDVYLWNASEIPLEYCFKIPAFFLEGKAAMLDYSYFEQLKREMCHQQKASLWMRFHQSNHLCKLLGKIAVLELSTVALQH